MAVTELDTELMLRMKHGESVCMEALLQRHRGPVIHFLHRRVQSQAIAEELAQNVFLRIYLSRGKYEPTAKFTTWMFRIAGNLALNWIRDRRRERTDTSINARLPRGEEFQYPDRKPSVEQMLIRRAQLDEVRRAVEELPERQRNVVIMHKYHGKSYAEIADELGCTPQAVKSLLFRAYSALRLRLSE
jgi:RNA polymerase sigma-70 factor (ECF subfamily)